MKSFATWSLPVAVSLLLHAGLFAWVTYRLSAITPASNQTQAITVELSGNISTPSTKQIFQETNPLAIKKFIQEADDKKTPIVLNTAPETSQAVESSIEQKNNSQQAANIAEGTPQSILNIQPLSKLTRLPSFLNKIEPVYPRSEQRLGSQAYVLAEVTIDEKGMVQNVSIVKSAGIAFDNAVNEALVKSTFVPGYIDKQAVAVRVLVPIRFKLK